MTAPRELVNVHPSSRAVHRSVLADELSARSAVGTTAVSLSVHRSPLTQELSAKAKIDAADLIGMCASYLPNSDSPTQKS